MHIAKWKKNVTVFFLHLQSKSEKANKNWRLSAKLMRKKKELQLFMFNSSFIEFVHNLIYLIKGTTSSYIKRSCIVCFYAVEWNKKKRSSSFQISKHKN